jgi:hypothetical protein
MTDATQEDLARRLRRLEDMDEIRQLYIDYGRHLDAGDAAAYATLLFRPRHPDRKCDRAVKLTVPFRRSGQDTAVQAQAEIDDLAGPARPLVTVAGRELFDSDSASR